MMLSTSAEYTAGAREPGRTSRDCAVISPEPRPHAKMAARLRTKRVVIRVRLKPDTTSDRNHPSLEQHTHTNLGLSRIAKAALDGPVEIEHEIRHLGPLDVAVVDQVEHLE